jgi:hypothetical protein
LGGAGGPSLLWATNYFGWGKTEGIPGFDWFWDPLSGYMFATLSNLSSNVVAYYKFDEQQPDSTITAQDWAGSAAPVGFGSVSGAQKNPASGNTMSFFGSKLTTGVYNLVDSFDVNSIDDIYRRGAVTFEDENGIRHRVGTIFYDLGMVVFDNEYNTGNFASASGLPLLSTIGRWGFSFNNTLSANSSDISPSGVTGNVSGFWVQNLFFTSQTDIERMVINLAASGTEMTQTQNPTGIDQTTGDQVLPESAGYVTGVGLYNDSNELVAVAKLNSPIRKDQDHDVVTQVFLDF